MKPATHGSPYTVPPEPNRLPAIVLAVAAHALLLAFLWIGISWQNTEPPAVEAEVWDMKVQSAAAPALPPPPPPEAEPEPEPTPVPPPPPPPKVAEPEPVKPAAPDINLEREKKLAEQKKQRERELLEKKERERELAEKKEREELKAKQLADKKAAEKKELEKKELEKKELAKKAEADKKLAAEKAEKADADKKKVAAEKAAKAKAESAEQARLDKQRDAELKRMMGAAGSGGEAQKSSAPKIDAGYIGKLTALIKSNTTFAGSTDVPGNPKAVFKVELLPTGEILSVRLSKSSGVPQFDDAVERGINKSSPLPKKKDGTVERTIVVNFSMKDLD
jgi:colicin import membrane protein